jgi:hypothetical protein
VAIKIKASATKTPTSYLRAFFNLIESQLKVLSSLVEVSHHRHLLSTITTSLIWSDLADGLAGRFLIELSLLPWLGPDSSRQ